MTFRFSNSFRSFQFNDSIVLRVPGQEYDGRYDTGNLKCQGKGN